MFVINCLYNYKAAGVKVTSSMEEAEYVVKYLEKEYGGYYIRYEDGFEYIMSELIVDMQKILDKI